MSMELKLPELGEGIEAAKVLSVLVSPGDQVRADQTVIEVETEKATAEVPTEAAGTVKSVSVKEGDDIRVGQVILVLEETAAEAPSKAPANEAPTAEAPAPEETPAPAPQTTAAPEAPKPSSAPAAPATAPAAEAPPREAPSSTAPVVTPAPPAAPVAPPSPAPTPTAPRSAGGASAAPSVRRLARELGLDIGAVPGTGPGGRISSEDVMAFARRIISRRASTAPAGSPGHRAVGTPVGATDLPDFTQWGEIERLPMSGIRRATADAMAQSWSQIPAVTQFDRADITELEAFRRRYSKRAEGAGAKLTVTAIATKVAAAALKAFPGFNSSLDTANEEVIHRKYVHVGVAVDTDHGLLVPVIRNVDQKSVIQIAVELGSLAEKARSRKISLDELRGGCFTVSNLGGLGTTYFSPIVNWPQAAILGLGRGSQEAMWRDDTFVPRMMLPLSLSYDHRLVDGADAARFLRWIAEAMENPLLMALEV